MNSQANFLANSVEYNLDDFAASSANEKIVEFYEEATADYEHWSENFNMHLGFYRRGLNPFDREKMLEQANLEIAARLQIKAHEKNFLIDLGCGTGAIARSVARKFSYSSVKGVTISPAQVNFAKRINSAENLQNRIEIFECEYTSLPFADGAADGVWAVESACYADGAGKENLVREMARVLKTGGRFAVADCFIKRQDEKLNFLVAKSYRAVCDCWALSEMPALDKFAEALEKHGFRDILIEDISWRVAPSLAHAPFAVSSFVLKKLLAGEKLNRHSINNLKASLLALLLGLNRTKFSYCLISGKRG